MKVFWRVKELTKTDMPTSIMICCFLFLLCFFLLFISDIATGSQHNVKPSSPSDHNVQKDTNSLTFLSVRNKKIVDQTGNEIKLRGLHYDCFYTDSSLSSL